jgi:hypothetical protein
MLVMLASCGGGGNDANPTAPPTQPPSESQGTPNPVDNDRTDEPVLDRFNRPVYDELGRPMTSGFTEHPMDLDERVVNVLTTQMNLFTYAENLDATTNETIAIMGILREIEEDYNFTFEFHPLPTGARISTYLHLYQVAGDTPYDMVITGSNSAGMHEVYLNNSLFDLNSQLTRDIIDLERNPWPAETEFGDFLGRQTGVSFLIANSGLLLRSVFTFNKDHMDRLSLPNLYEMAMNKTWTWDAFEDVCYQIVANSNGEIIPLVFERETNVSGGFVFGNGGVFVEGTTRGMTFVGHTNDATLEGMEFINRLARNGFIVPETEQAVPRMADGRAMFHMGDYEFLRRFTRQQVETEYSFGLLPTPMGPRMDEYVNVSGAATLYSIVANVPQADEIAAIIVSMANRLSIRNVVETELFFGVQDNESADILDMLINGLNLVDNSRSWGHSGVRIRESFNNVVAGTETPRASFERFAPVIQGILDQFKLD